MRIDTSFTTLPVATHEKVNRPSTEDLHSSRSEGGDLAQLSTGDSAMTGLSSKAMAEPEIRAERVSSLRAAVINGTYAPNPQVIADAMFNELF